MKIYNQDKTNILTEYDLDKGYLKDDYIDIILPEIQEVKEQGHYEVIKEYENNGKDVKWVVDVEGVKYQPKRTVKEHIKVYVLYNKEEMLDILREKRENICFKIINRGELWYNRLTDEQKQDLDNWYQEWLDITDKYVYGMNINTIIPRNPIWLK